MVQTPIIDDIFGDCGKTSSWNYDVANNILVVSGDGSIEAFENANDRLRKTIYDPYNLGPWYNEPSFRESSIPKLVKTVIISEGITGVESMVFWGFKSLETVLFPESIQHVSESAFSHIENLTFLVKKGSFAEQIVDSMGWRKNIIGG